MLKDNEDLYRAKAEVLKAMAHPTRLFILEELQKGEQCVNELTALIGSDVSTVSKHLSLLKKCGLVSDEKRGNCIYYTLLIPCLSDFMGCVEKVVLANGKRYQEIAVSCCKKK